MDDSPNEVRYEAGVEDHESYENDCRHPASCCSQLDGETSPGLS
jgi:hypothetical protein